jgi:hypothetical protein
MFCSKDGHALSLRAAIANLVACGALVLAADDARAGGFDRNENFVAFLPALGTQEATDKAVKALLDRANYHRQRIALEWLGEELPPSVGQAIINVDYSGGSDRGLTWAKDHPDRKFHSIYLVVPREDLLDSLLAHEIAHVVLATRYPHPHRLPSWLEEGIASRYDDADRQNTRQRIEQWFVKTGSAPRLANVLASDNIPADDRETYAVCASVTSLLLTRGDKQTLLRFGQLAAQTDPDRALAQCYGIRGVEELESLWRAWLARAGR